ncbi:Transcriptional regulator, GntR family [Arthrobacter sp. PAMC 25486]|uniref:FadR/GntR family transcriptional regulator n=1 Tax=Arthrobacter sp. PAMC 25486 TaxID=1494608 RepID=UPI000535D297|nr:FadR/GntR family transcriptional regulator [Arthrobacter sp. PAMC 25486]AIY03404.1 Transcriptional regulator, GntR family [Arthrobacter sp. PAMC 25486]
MARKSLTGVVADDLLDRIVAGEFTPGSLVPGELELSAQHDVSRMTVREAMKTLTAQRILRVERGRGTFVNPLSQWGSLEAVLRVLSEGENGANAAVQLIELRRMLETGACELAASRISDADLLQLRIYVDHMRRAHDSGNVAMFVESDLAFHDIILHAAGNVFVAVLFEPLHRVLENRREETSQVPEIQANAIDMHEAILQSLTSRDPERSRVSMDNHMMQTLRDLKQYVLGWP